jgi:hypothetical protein
MEFNSAKAYVANDEISRLIFNGRKYFLWFIVVHKIVREYIILSRVWVAYKTGFGWMIEFIAPYKLTQLGTTGNTALLLFYTLSSSPFHTH